MAKSSIISGAEITKSGLIYYLARGLQRLGLVASGVAVASLYAQYFSSMWVDGTLDSITLPVIEMLTMMCLLLSIFTLGMSFLLLSFPRVKLYQKSLVFDGILISFLFIVLTTYVEPLIRWMLSTFAYW